MPKPVHILGLSCYYHDSAAVLLRDGVIVFAAQEERYTRVRHDASFPAHVVRHALERAGIGIADVDAVVFYEKPLRKFLERILPTAIRVWPRGFAAYHRAMQEWLGKKLWMEQGIRRELGGYRGKLLFTAHHESHAASAFFASGFPESAVLTVDGVGESATTAIFRGEGTALMPLEEIHFPHSLGLLYSAVTHYLGFRVNSAEYKVMGLAPYGEPTYLEQMHRLIRLRSDGSYVLAMEFFEYEHGDAMTGKAMERLLGQPRRRPEDPLTQFHKDIARSLQAVTEEAMLGLARRARERTGSRNLCLAGGVALNCVANAAIARAGIFDAIFIQPAAGDAGGALGAALAAWHKEFGGARVPRMEHVFLGTEYSDDACAAFLRERGIPHERLGDALAERVSALLEGESVVGWFQGRMEFGPRSLGARSILADARNKENWRKVNLKIKFRESFRPFAPTVLAERAGEWFADGRESPYMLLTADVLPEKRAAIPAVTHVDGSARLQTVRADQHPRYHALLSAFERRTGCPVVVNTSFNVRGEPIVESPEQALQCFLHTDMDYLALGDCLVRKIDLRPEQLPRRGAHLARFAPD